MYYSKRMKTGFTLAEVLITLGIIGIVVMMTIPIMQKIQDNQFKEAFKKEFSDMSNAAKLAQMDSGMNLYNTSGQRSASGSPDFVMESLFKPYMKISKFCDNNSTPSVGNCWHNDLAWSNYTGTKMSFSDCSCSVNTNYCQSMILENGMLVLNHSNVSAGIYGGYGGYRYTMFFVDVNGFKGPNVIGRDIQNITIASPVSSAVSTDQFAFVPGYVYQSTSLYCTSGGTGIQVGANCAKLIMQGIDY